MAFASSSVVVRIQLQDPSRNLIYTGTSTNALYIWGAQLELGEYYEDLRNDLDNYRYIRSRGVQSQAFSFRFGLDQTPDFVIPEERVFQSVRLTAHNAGSFFNTQIERIDNTSGSAARTQELFIPETWYQLAPLYSSYINLFNNPNSTRDGVTVGELDETVLDQVYDYEALSGSDDFQFYTSSISVDYSYVSNIDDLTADLSFDMLYELTGTADLLTATTTPFPSDLLA